MIFDTKYVTLVTLMCFVLLLILFPALSSWKSVLITQDRENFIIREQSMGRPPIFYYGYPWYGICDKAWVSLKEFKSLILTDSVMEILYKEKIDVKKLVEIQINSPVKYYSTYRNGNRIFWTEKKIQVHSGEILFTDGSIFIRSFNCAQLNISGPEGPTDKNEPQSKLFLQPKRG